jgi:hypothetical protein
MSRRYNGIVTYQGIEFEVEGDYVPYQSAVLTADAWSSTPPEGGYFEDFYIKHCGDDMYDFLRPEVCETIEELALDGVESGLKEIE